MPAIPTQACSYCNGSPIDLSSCVCVVYGRWEGQNKNVPLQTKNTVEILQTELKHERQARAEAEVTISRLELDIKKLRADLHVSTYL